MSNLQIIQELCGICDMQNRIIRAQSDALAQLGAVVMEEERAEAADRLTALLGRDEVPDEYEMEE
ncbi:hypothetical protein [uncultured Dysosmobacter sp.]|uniref:hypothetical protein n=1 Tax=uncultured Dysosmobacter sp. TaxID=2591384 RepID=UPI0026280ECC|nr:hypothetical protein [uncultured Dysosmobacter sp.]